MTSPKKGDRVIAVYPLLDFDTFEVTVVENRHGVVTVSTGAGSTWRCTHHPDLPHPVGSREYEYLVALNQQLLEDNEASRLLVRYLFDRKEATDREVDELVHDIYAASRRVTQSSPEVGAVAGRVREALALLRAAQDAWNARVGRRRRGSVPEVG